MSKKSIYKIITVTLAMTLLIWGIYMPSTYAATKVNVIIDGKKLETDVPAVIKNSRTMVPFRAVFEALGAGEVLWDQSTKTVIASDQSTELMMTIGSKTILVNGDPVPTDTPPMIIEGRTMVPLSMVSKHLGKDVSWDNATHTATVTSKNSDLSMLFGESTPPTVTEDPTQPLIPEIKGTYAFQDLNKNRYVANFQGGKVTLKDIDKKTTHSGIYTSSGENFTLDAKPFTSTYTREDHQYKGNNIILMTDEKGSSTFAMTPISFGEYNSY